jgi:DNA-directed RNA polymerase subunit M/transcription elongation factor TFIIS
MEFCQVCENMLFLTNVEEKLMFQCKKCGFEKDATSNVVCSLSFQKKEQHTSVIHKYTKLDPTLPRMKLKCPLETCKNHQEGDIIQVRYNETELSYAYLCPECDTIWKMDKNWY